MKTAGAKGGGGGGGAAWRAWPTQPHKHGGRAAAPCLNAHGRGVLVEAPPGEAGHGVSSAAAVVPHAQRARASCKGPRAAARKVHALQAACRAARRARRALREVKHRKRGGEVIGTVAQHVPREAVHRWRRPGGGR